MDNEYDIAIIGAGVIGCAIAHELAGSSVNICVLERGAEPAVGTSKANSGIIHAGYDPEPGTLMAEMNVAGARQFPALARELGITYRKTGSLVAALCEEELPALETLMQRGKVNGARGLRLIGRDELRRLEPKITVEAKGALLAEEAAIVSPYELTIALAETAAANGAVFHFDTPVLTINALPDKLAVHTNSGIFKASVVINAAGVHADDIAGMIGDHSFSIMAVKGEEAILDKEYGQLVSHVLFPLPSAASKGIIVAPTAHGNLLIGPTAEPANKNDRTTSRSGLEEVITGATRLVPELPRTGVITSYAGLRAVADTDDFVINHSPVNGRLINVAGIKSPGLTAAPAIARRVKNLVATLLQLTPKIYAYRRPTNVRFNDLTPEEQHALIQQNPTYGRIVCRCEQISEGEIRNLFRSPLPPRTLDGVKRRIRAGMGRCQGGFCTPEVLRIMSAETGKEMTSLHKDGNESNIVLDQARALAGHEGEA